MPIIESNKIKHYKYRDGEILKILSSSMNFNVNFVKPLYGTSFGLPLPNGSYTGALAMIEYGKVDLHANIRSISRFGTQNLSMLTTIEICEFFFLTPKHVPGTKYLNISIFWIYDFNVRIFMVILLSLIAILWYLMQLIAKRYIHSNGGGSGESPNLLEIILIIFKVFHFGPVVKQHQHTYNRIILSTLLLFSIIVCYSYQGTIVSQLSAGPENQDMMTIEDVIKSEMPILSHTSEPDMFKPPPGTPIDVNSVNYKLLQRNTVNNTAPDANVELLARDKNFVYLLRQNYVNYYKANNFNQKTGRDFFHVVPESPLSYICTYTVPKSSPYKKKMNEILLETIEFGFGQYGMIAAKRDNLLNYTKRTRMGSIDVKNDIRISIGNLTILFLVWGILLTVALVVFIVELAWFNY